MDLTTEIALHCQAEAAIVQYAAFSAGKLAFTKEQINSVFDGVREKSVKSKIHELISTGIRFKNMPASSVAQNQRSSCVADHTGPFSSGNASMDRAMRYAKIRSDLKFYDPDFQLLVSTLADLSK